MPANSLIFSNPLIKKKIAKIKKKRKNRKKIEKNASYSRTGIEPGPAGSLAADYFTFNSLLPISKPSHYVPHHR